MVTELQNSTWQSSLSYRQRSNQLVLQAQVALPGTMLPKSEANHSLPCRGNAVIDYVEPCRSLPYIFMVWCFIKQGTSGTV